MDASDQARVVQVTTSATTYDVRIGIDVLAELGARLTDGLGRVPHRVMLIHDDALTAAQIRVATGSLEQAGCQVHLAPAHADEHDKSIPVVTDLLTRCAEARLDRQSVVVALGGGLVGDVAGFVGATYMRGIPVVPCPTTLLAMVDASVGGKTGVNLQATVGDASRLLKNLVGAFHQPVVVLADVRTLQTLDDRQFVSGLAECVKHALISADWDDPDLLDWTEANATRLVDRDDATLISLIERNVRVKARVVEADEREEAGPGAPGRMLLNLGHTFAHAIETLPGLHPDGDTSRNGLLHGEAVSLGLCCAAHCAVAAGDLAEADLGRITSLLTDLGLPTSVSGLPATETIVSAMARDKKGAGGRLRLVVPRALGHCAVVEGTPADAVAAAIDSIRAIT